MKVEAASIRASDNAAEVGGREDALQTLQRHPVRHVFGVVDRSEEVKDILEDLFRHGAARHEVQIVGEDQDDNDNEDRFAPDQHDQHGVREGVTHGVEMLSEEHEFNELYQSHVEAGRC